MKATINLSISGIRCKFPTWTPDKAACKIYIHDGIRSSNFLNISAFEGTGEEYKRREVNKIEISQHGELIFCGSFTELCKNLKK